MDMGTQSQILEISNLSAGKPLVVLGSPDPESAELAALSVVSGDPTFSGPLSGVPLGLLVYHVLEDEIASAVDPNVYEDQVGLMKLALDTDGIRSTMRRIREDAGLT